jgi:hypothetical protein
MFILATDSEIITLSTAVQGTLQQVLNDKYVDRKSKTPP